MAELRNLKVNRKLFFILLAGLILSNLIMVSFFDHSIMVRGDPVTPPVDEEWTKLASDGDEGAGCNLKAIFTQMLDGVLFFKVETYRNWATINDVNILILLDIDQDPRTGAPDGVLTNQQTSLGADYAISIGNSGNRVLRWSSSLWTFDATGMPTLDYYSTPNNHEVIVGVQANSVAETDGKLDLAVADSLSSWDWVPNYDYWGWSTAHVPFVQQSEEHQMVISMEMPRTVEPGTSMAFSAVAINYGTATETHLSISVTCENMNGVNQGGSLSTYASTAPGGFQVVSTLGFTANPEAPHTVTASVTPVAGETVTEDNTQTKFMLVTRKLAVISDNTELDTINPILDNMQVPYDRYVNNKVELYTESLTLLNGYRAVILNINARDITLDEKNALNGYLAAGGKLLIAGVDSMKTWPDNNMVSVIRSLSYGDGLTTDGNLFVTNEDHPIMNGYYGHFVNGYHITGLDDNYDQVSSYVLDGVYYSSSVASLTESWCSKILVAESLPGTVVYWNGNGVNDWATNVDCRAMLKNTLIWFMDTAPPTTGHNYNSGLNTADFIFNIPVTDVYGIAESYYTINGSATKSVSVDGMPLITEEGINVIEFWAVDLGGNVMGHDSVELYLDKAAPTGAIQIDNGALATDTAAVTLHLTAEDKTFIYQYRLSDDGVWDTEPWQFDAAFTGKSVVDTTKAYTLLSGEGAKTVYYQLKDYIGEHISDTYSATIILDTTAPTGTMEINNGATYTNSRTVNVALSTSDLSGIEYMRLSNDNATWSEWQTYTATTIWTLPEENGLQTVYCQIKDYASLITTLSASITIDTVPPIGSIQINNGTTYTTSAAVTLSLSASDATSGVSQVRFSNDNTQWSTWETAVASKDWTLAVGDGAKNVYYQIKDNANLISNYSTTITLDTTLPTGTIQINNGAQYTNTVTASLTLTAVDANGVAFMRFSNDNTTWSTWETFSTTKSWTLTDGDGVKTVYVQFRDNAGLIATYSAIITLDNTPPTGNIQINSDAKYTNSTVTNLTLTFADANGVVSMRFSNDNLTWSTWENYGTTKNWTLTTGDGAKAVYVQFQDNAGLTSTVNASIILDTEAPTLYPMIHLVSLKNKQLSFDAQYTEDNCKIAGYLWDFGDGSQSSDMFVVHGYLEAGNYTVSLTVKDCAGNIANGSMRVVIPEVIISEATPTPAPTMTPTPTIPATNTPSRAPTSSPVPDGSDTTTVWILVGGLLFVLAAGGLVVWFKKK